MVTLFAMAGLAEAAWAEMLGLMCAGSFVIATLVLIAMVYRSRLAAVICLLLIGALAWQFCPWEAFTAATSDDPDWQSILSSWLSASVWFILISCAAALFSAWTLWRKSE